MYTSILPLHKGNRKSWMVVDFSFPMSWQRKTINQNQTFLDDINSVVILTFPFIQHMI